MAEEAKGGEGGAEEVFLAFLRLGLTAFGGPVAHLGYFRDEFVRRRGWLSDHAFADLVALCQFLPGPASSQVGMGLGLMRAGLPGMLCAFLAFTLPSALLMFGFAYGLRGLGAAGGGWLDGLKAAAVGVVAQAVISMARTLCATPGRAALGLVAGLVATAAGGIGGQLGAMALGALAGLIWLRADGAADAGAMPPVPVPHAVSVAALVAFCALLAGLPVLAAGTGSGAAALADSFYRAGALVFGGGHVVLPLLDAEVVADGLVSREDFIAGYAAAQAVPGPLFTFAAFLGAVATRPPSGPAGAALALAAIFLPSALLVLGTLGYWARLRTVAAARRVLAGVNAAVVGLLAAALWNPVLPEGVTSAPTALLAVAALLALEVGRVPAWAVVGAAALTGAVAL